MLGTEGGTYYQSERELTEENAKVVVDFAKNNPRYLVDQAVEVSREGLAPKNDQALFALAAAAGLAPDAEDRNYALSFLPQVARTGTHLFQFVSFAEQFRGWGRALKRAVADWYTQKDADKLAYQLVKYRQRNGWSHADLLRLSHPLAPTSQHDDVFRFALNQADFPGARGDYHADFVHSDSPKILGDFVMAQSPIWNSARVAVSGRLPWEAFPTEDLNTPELWQELLAADAVPYNALVRQLPRLTNLGLLMSGAARTTILDKLTNEEQVRRSRIHPLTVLNAQRTYAAGRSQRGSNTWTPNRQVVDALDDAFYKSFKNVEPTGKRILLALDVSGSMSFSYIANMAITPREASAAMALATLAAEPAGNVDVVGFTGGSRFFGHGEAELTPLDLSPRRRLDDNIQAISNLPFGGTDCSLPMKWALKNDKKYDAFVVYTDSETWSPDSPADHLRKYRRLSGIDAKLVVAGMTATDFSIADPNDPGKLDIAGIDSIFPAVQANFIAGRI
jgi:60 kDa SS-A/Ro ribonucleoprotein